MAKGGMSGLKARKTNQGNNDSNENIKSLKSDNVIEVKEHRLVIDIPEDLYWKFKTTSGMRKQKMKESIQQAITQWIESA